MRFASSLIVALLLHLTSLDAPADPGETPPAAPADVASAPEPEQVFAAEEAALLEVYDGVKRFLEAKEPAEVYDLAASVPALLRLAQSTVQTLKQAIPDPRKFEASNARAKEIQLGFKLNQLENVIAAKAQDKLTATIADLATAVRDDVAWLEQKDVATSAAATILERVERNIQTLEAIAADQPATSQAKALLPKAKKAYQKVQKRVAKNRLPKDAYTGGDREELVGKLSALYAARYPESKVHRIVIISPDWSERTEAKVNNDDRIEAGLYRHLYAHVATQKGKQFQVYSVGFRRTWQRSSKSFGPIELHSFGESYPILKANIAK